MLIIILFSNFAEFPIEETAIESKRLPTSKQRLFGIPTKEQIDAIDKKESPAPTLSITLLEKAKIELKNNYERRI